MAMVDSSIYFQQDMPDVMGGIEKGMRMRDMIGQRREDQSMKDAFKRNTITAEDGTTSLDKKKLLSDLSGISPEKAMAYQEKFREQDAAEQKAKADKMLRETDLIARAAGSIKDQGSYDQAISFLGQSGVDVSSMPKAYDPNLVRQHQMRALSVKEQLENQFRERETRIKEREKGIEAKGQIVPGATVMVGAKPTPQDAEKVKSALTKRKNMMGSLDALDEMVKQNGTEWFSAGNAATDMATTATDIRMTAKELYDLGALSGPDMDLISKVIPDPTDMKWAFTYNSKGKVQSQLAKAREIMERAAQNVASSRGYNIPASEKPGKQGPAQAAAPVLSGNQIEWAD